MNDIERRIRRIEDALNVGKEPIVVSIVHYGDGELPPERTENGITVKFVRYTDLKQENEAIESNKR
jgi:ABC-type metal ion transport system substrate-binding protein